MFHLIRRGREKLRLLTKESFAVQVDAAGKKFVYQVVDELDKNHRANDQPDDSPGEGRMYERPESPYCPVKTFELYLSKLNPTLSCLWQRPRATSSRETSGLEGKQNCFPRDYTLKRLTSFEFVCYIQLLCRLEIERA